MSCECSHAGWCARHGIEKSAHWHHLCKTREDYFLQWEEGRGPGQHAAKQSHANTPPSNLSSGPGTELSKLISERGYSVSRGCSCNDKIRKMDQWGSEGCRANLEEIVEWLVASARTAGWLERMLISTPGVRSHAIVVIRRMALEAIRRHEQNVDARD